MSIISLLIGIWVVLICLLVGYYIFCSVNSAKRNKAFIDNMFKDIKHFDIDTYSK